MVCRKRLHAAKSSPLGSSGSMDRGLAETARPCPPRRRRLPIRQQGCPRCERNPPQPGGGGGAHRPRPDCRQIGAAVLSGLDQFDQYAAGPSRARVAHAPAWRRSPRSLRRQARGPAAPHNPGRRPPPQRTRDRDPAVNVRHCLGVRRHGASTPPGATPCHDFMRADDPEAFLGEHPDDRREQPVVAGERGSADARQDASTIGVRAKSRAATAGVRADHHQVLAA